MAFKYQALAEQITFDIKQHKLSAGQPLPALRKFAAQHQVSLATATKTYEWLQRQGLVVAKAQSGFYVKGQVVTPMLSQPKLKSVSIKHDPTHAIFDILQNALTYDTVGLSNGYLDASLRPTTHLQRAIKRTAQIANLTVNSYGDAQGNEKLRLAISQVMAQRHCQVQPKQIVVTNGCLEAVNIALQQVSKVNDIVAVFTPCYSGLLTALKHNQRQVLEIPCGPNGPDMSHLTELFKRKAFQSLIFSSTATNPLGFTLSDDIKQQLANLAKDHQIYIIEDDTFGSLSYDMAQNNSKHSLLTQCPSYAYEHNGYIIYCASFSKDIAPNMRIGWIASSSLIKAFTQHKMALNITCNMPCQLAMADYLLAENYPAQLRQLNHTLQLQMNKLQTSVLAHFPKDIRLSQPQGGFFLWVELPTQINVMALYELAVKDNICFMPGQAFSMSGQYDHCIRLSINQVWSDSLEQAISRLGQLIMHLVD